MNERIRQLVIQSGAGHRAGISGHVFDEATLEKFVKLLLEEAVSELQGVRTKLPDGNPSRILDLAVNRVRAIDDVLPPKPKKPIVPTPTAKKLTGKAKARAARREPQATPMVPPARVQTQRGTPPGGFSNLFAFSLI